MKQGLTDIVAGGSLVLVLAVVLGLPRSALAQAPLTISATGLTCTNGVCDPGTFTAQVQDPTGDTAQQAFSTTIDPPLPLVVNTPSNCCSAGTVGIFYQVHFFAVGGVQPYTWDLVAGQFPPGLSLDRSGLLSGTPTTTGTFTFTVQVTDKAGTQATRGPFSITVS